MSKLNMIDLLKMNEVAFHEIFSSQHPFSGGTTKCNWFINQPSKVHISTRLQMKYEGMWEMVTYYWNYMRRLI